MSDKIDFVVTWVDGNDPNWQKERNSYASYEQVEIDNNPCRFRDWDTLRYWFRGVEKFAPWVNNIFFVTCGHLPKWLNVNHPKLKIVKHSDFIPKEYLPTYNSNVIEFHFHKIKELSERFVYFNDDMFLINTVTHDRFFKNGLPCDMGEIGVKPETGLFGLSVFWSTDLINRSFSPKKVIRKDLTKWVSIKYPLDVSFRNYVFMRKMDLFPHFVNSHLPQGFLKRIYDDVWSHCESDLIRTSKSKFRVCGDAAFWLIRYWQLASGRFTPYNIFKDGRFFVITDDSVSTIFNCISRQEKTLVCLNDTDNITKYEECKRKILEAFDVILPNKSSFENA